LWSNPLLTDLVSVSVHTTLILKNKNPYTGTILTKKFRAYAFKMIQSDVPLFLALGPVYLTSIQIYPPISTGFPPPQSNITQFLFLTTNFLHF
jgi:hypothetical protein